VKLGLPEIVGFRLSGEFPVLITDVTDLLRVEPMRFPPKLKLNAVSDAALIAAGAGEEFDPHPERRHSIRRAGASRSKYFTIERPFERVMSFILEPNHDQYVAPITFGAARRLFQLAFWGSSGAWLLLLVANALPRKRRESNLFFYPSRRTPSARVGCSNQHVKPICS
jgi:hypothetical protein